jgi:hypothetical protein
MTIKASSTRRFRTILDCSLILLLILIALTSERPIQAKVGFQPMPGNTYVDIPSNLARPNALKPGPVNADHPAELAPQDDNTLAAMIAAENAALNLPNTTLLYLPVINR